MTNNLNKSLMSIVLTALSIGSGAAAPLYAGDESLNKPKTLSENYDNQHDKGAKDASVILLSDVNAAMGVAGVIGGEYVAETTRELQFDALRLGPWFAHIGIHEEGLFDPSPNQFNNELQYIALGSETAAGRISAFWDHTCNNPGRKLPENEKSGIHWNELGVGYASTAMRIGHKNDGIKFNSGSEWLNKINWEASFSKIWMRTENDYEWMFKLGARNDVYRLGNHILYARLSFDSIYDNRGVNFKSIFEIGDRIHFNKAAYLTSFISYQHFHDWYSQGIGDWYRLGPGEDFFLAGLSLEIGLDQVKSDNDSTQEKQKISWNPRFSITGGYTNIIDNDHYGHSSDLAFDLELFKLYPDKTIFLNTYAGILILPDNLIPNTVKYGIGPSLTVKLNSWDLRILHSYTFLYGIEHTGVIRKYNLLGLELKNNNDSFWNARAGVGVYPSTTNFDYRGNLHGTLGYTFSMERLIPYLDFSGRYL